MKSAAARIVDVVLRVSRRGDDVAAVLEGREPRSSAEPTRALSKVADVVSHERDGHELWELVPRKPRAGAPDILFLHGGSYINGFSPFHWRFLTRLVSATGARVLAPDYPLAPEHHAAEVVNWTLGLYRSLARTGDVVLMGDSAGGGLALATALAARDAGVALPTKLVLLAPWLDAGMTSPHGAELDAADVMLSRAGLLACAQAYAGPAGLADPTVSPLFADLAGLPPTSVYCGTADQLIADARRLRDRARGEYPGWSFVLREAPGMVHDFMLIDPLPEGRRAQKTIFADLMAGIPK